MKKLTAFSVLLSLFMAGFGQAIYQIGYYNQNGLFGLAVKDNYMILCNGNIVDNTVPSTPLLTGQVTINGLGTTVVVQGDYAFFGTGMTAKLQIVNISNPLFPISAGQLSYNGGNGVFGMDIKDVTLFAALGQDGILASVDITDKANPAMLDSIWIPGGQCRDVVIQGDYAFAAHDGGLKVIDISNVSNLAVLTSAGSGYNSIDLGDSLVFLGKSNGGVDVFDVSNPLSPAPVFAIPNANGNAWDIKYRDHHLYLATNSLGLFVYKIDGLTWAEMATFPNTGNGQSFGVELQDSLILLTGLINGVAILQYDSAGVIIGLNDPATSIPGNTLNIYPNPFYNQICISSDDLSIEKVELLDSQGRQVKLESFDPISGKLNLPEIAKGIYLIRITTSEGIVTRTIVRAD